jgi:phosphoribosylformylglycinamidine cyclo-ligase
MELRIDWQAWERPRIFNLIRELGDVPEADMQRTFNLGVGLLMIVHQEHVDRVMSLLADEQPFLIGDVVASGSM